MSAPAGPPVTLAATVIATSAGPIETAVAGQPTGSGAPVLLGIHGMPGDWRQARLFARDLGRFTTVVLPSRPGYGCTPRAAGRTPASQAAAHVALLDSLGVERAVVLGISGGGPSAYAFAANHPDRCSGLVLCCAMAPHLMPIPMAMRVLVNLPVVWEAAAAADRRRSRRMLAHPAAITRYLAKELTAAEQTRLAEDPLVRGDLEGFFADKIEAMRGVAGLRNDVRWVQSEQAHGPRPWPAGRDLPARILHGDLDAVVSVEHARWYAEQIPGAVLQLLPGFGHAIPITARANVIAAAADVLAVSG